MIRTLTAAAFAFALAAPAFAQTNAPAPGMIDARSEMKQACRADMQSLCGSTAHGQARQQCMKDNRDKLSQSCKDARAHMHEVKRASKAG